MPLPVSAMLSEMRWPLSSVSKMTSMAPPLGVNFMALDMRLLKIFSSLSASSHIVRLPSSPCVRIVMPFSSAFMVKMARYRCSSAMISFCSTCSRSVSFSSLLKSSIWLTRRSMRLTLLATMSSSRCSCGRMSPLLRSCSTGPAIMVSGVRNSCETFAKKLMFILLMRCSCSRSSSALRASRFSSSMRFLAFLTYQKMAAAAKR